MQDSLRCRGIQNVDLRGRTSKQGRGVACVKVSPLDGIEVYRAFDKRLKKWVCPGTG